jgi:hypothetical protein
MPERALVHVLGRRPPKDRNLETGLQQLPPSLIPVGHRASAVRQAIHRFPQQPESLGLDCPLCGRRSICRNSLVQRCPENWGEVKTFFDTSSMRC